MLPIRPNFLYSFSSPVFGNTGAALDVKAASVLPKTGDENEYREFRLIGNIVFFSEFPIRRKLTKAILNL